MKIFITNKKKKKKLRSVNLVGVVRHTQARLKLSKTAADDPEFKGVDNNLGNQSTSFWAN